MDAVSYLFIGIVVFARNFVGTILAPYETYRRIVDHGRLVELVPIGLLLASYFAVASFVKAPSFRPFLLTKQFVALSVTAGASFVLVSTTLWVAGIAAGGVGSFRRFILAWGYTMVPTVFWFFMTSILYLVLPPPRTTQTSGVLFSIVYLIVTITLFFWKILLGYLSLRFGLRLDLGKIALVALICVPLVAIYSMIMYRLGVFKVPFL